MNCFGIVRKKIDIATSRFKPAWVINEKNYKELETYCDAMDEIAESFNGRGFTAEVDPDSKEISIDMEIFDLIVEPKEGDETFVELTTKALSVRFSQTSDETLLITFVFPGIWDKRKEVL